MEDLFNPYRAWLGWQPARAPDYYELLGLDRAETDRAKILRASERVIALVRSQRPGPHAQVWSRLLDEIRAARECLADSSLRGRYNQSLQRSTLFTSATGDLQTAKATVAIPPTPWAAGPSPVYDAQRGFVSVNSVKTDAANTSELGDSIPLPKANAS